MCVCVRACVCVCALFLSVWSYLICFTIKVMAIKLGNGWESTPWEMLPWPHRCRWRLQGKRDRKSADGESRARSPNERMFCKQKEEIKLIIPWWTIPYHKLVKHTYCLYTSFKDIVSSQYLGKQCLIKGQLIHPSLVTIQIIYGPKQDTIYNVTSVLSARVTRYFNGRISVDTMLPRLCT